MQHGWFLERLIVIEAKLAIESVAKLAAYAGVALLRFARLWHEERKPDKRRILRELLRFSIDNLGAVPLTEHTIAGDDRSLNPESR